MNHFPPLTTSQYQHLAADLDVPVAGFPYPTQQDMKAGNAIRVLVAEREALQVRLIQQVTLVEQCMVEMNRNADMGEKAEKERDALQARVAELESVGSPDFLTIPVEYQYAYPDGHWRCSNGKRINGDMPIRARALYARKDSQ